MAKGTTPTATQKRARQTSRRDRYKLRRTIQEHANYLNLSNTRRYCGAPRDFNGEVVIMHQPGAGGLAGIQRCASIWFCPVCSPRISQHRTEEIQKAIEIWNQPNADRSIASITLTMRHKRGDKLKDLREALKHAWGHATKGRAWRNAKELVDFTGFIRAIELTYGRNGWHLHIHSLAFINKDLANHPDTRAVFEQSIEDLFTRWANKLETMGLRRPLRTVRNSKGEIENPGLDYRFLAKTSEEAETMAKYLTKESRYVSRATSQALEMSRDDLKKGKTKYSLTTWQILDIAYQTDSAQHWALWQEYEEAIKGMHKISWGRGLRNEILALDPTFNDTEKTDQEIVDEEEEEATPLGSIRSMAYTNLARKEAHTLADIVTAAGAQDIPTAITEITAIMNAYNKRHGYPPGHCLELFIAPVGHPNIDIEKLGTTGQIHRNTHYCPARTCSHPSCYWQCCTC